MESDLTQFISFGTFLGGNVGLDVDGLSELLHARSDTAGFVMNEATFERVWRLLAENMPMVVRKAEESYGDDFHRYSGIPLIIDPDVSENMVWAIDKDHWADYLVHLSKKEAVRLLEAQNVRYTEIPGVHVPYHVPRETIPTRILHWLRETFL